MIALIVILILFFVALFVFWVFTPIIFDLPIDYLEIKKKYPNFFKRMLLVFLHGPMAIGAFSAQGVYNMYNMFKIEGSIKAIKGYLTYFGEWFRS